MVYIKLRASMQLDFTYFLAAAASTSTSTADQIKLARTVDELARLRVLQMSTPLRLFTIYGAKIVQ